MAARLADCRKLFDWKWTDLCRFGTQRFAKTTYYWVATIPLVAKALEQLEPSYNLTLFGTKFTIVLQLPFSWTMFYFGSVFIAVATLLFSLKCPAIISRYRTSREFIDSVNSEFIIRTEAIDASIRQNNEQILVSFAHWFCLRNDGEEHSQISAETVLVQYRVQSDRIADAFYFVRTRVNDEMPVLRRWIAACFTIGLSCFGVVFAEAFSSVVMVLLR